VKRVERDEKVQDTAMIQNKIDIFVKFIHSWIQEEKARL